MSDSVPDDLKTRVAWLYYVEGMTQDEVAKTVGLTRSRVLRILANARADGTVQIRVANRLSECVALERRLEAVWGLERAIVVPSPADREATPRIIGQQLGDFISAEIRSDMTIGLGWGETLTSGLGAIEANGHDRTTVISLLGGLTRVAQVNPSEFAWRVADRLGAECYLMAAPVYAPDGATRDALLTHTGIADVLDHAERLDLAIVSVGDLTPHSIFRRYGLLGSEEIASLEEAGAVGDLLCRFIDANGQPVAHPVNDRVMSIDHARLSSARRIVLASGGWHKFTAIQAALRAMPVSVLVTDQIVAERLCLRAEETSVSD